MQQIIMEREEKELSLMTQLNRRIRAAGTVVVCKVISIKGLLLGFFLLDTISAWETFKFEMYLWFCWGVRSLPRCWLSKHDNIFYSDKLLSTQPQSDTNKTVWFPRMHHLHLFLFHLELVCIKTYFCQRQGVQVSLLAELLHSPWTIARGHFSKTSCSWWDNCLLASGNLSIKVIK